MADDLERSLIGDVEGESSDDKHPIEVDVPSFGDGTSGLQLADIDPESLDPKHLTELADIDPESLDPKHLSGIDAVDSPSSDTIAADGGMQPIGGYRAEWHPSGGGGADDTFDPTDLHAGADASFGSGAADPYLRLADDIKYADDAAVPSGDGPHEVDIGGNLDEPTEVPIVPPDSGADDFAQAEGGPVAGGPENLDDVD